jgi:signal transduction histidine kinase
MTTMNRYWMVRNFIFLVLLALISPTFGALEFPRNGTLIRSARDSSLYLFNDLRKWRLTDPVLTKYEQGRRDTQVYDAEFLSQIADGPELLGADAVISTGRSGSSRFYRFSGDSLLQLAPSQVSIWRGRWKINPIHYPDSVIAALNYPVRNLAGGQRKDRFPDDSILEISGITGLEYYLHLNGKIWPVKDPSFLRHLQLRDRLTVSGELHQLSGLPHAREIPFEGMAVKSPKKPDVYQFRDGRLHPFYDWAAFIQHFVYRGNDYHDIIRVSSEFIAQSQPGPMIYSVEPPFTPQILSPLDDTDSYSDTLTVRWSRLSFDYNLPLTYKLYLGDQIPLPEMATLSDTSFRVESRLERGKSYFVQVRVFSDKRYIAGSSVIHFHVPELNLFADPIAWLHVYGVQSLLYLSLIASVFAGMVWYRRRSLRKQDHLRYLLHDIKNPLYGARNMLMKLNQRAEHLPQLQEISRDTLLAVERMELILQENLDLMLNENLQRGAIDPANLVRESLNVIRVSGIESRVHNAAGALQINGDEKKLRRVFENIIINAIEAANEKGRITIHIHQKGDYLRFAFADCGTGIAKEYLDRIWQKDRRRDARGFGLGLPYCRQIVEQHGGSIKIFSRLEQGTIVFIRLPLSEGKKYGPKYKYPGRR